MSCSSVAWGWYKMWGGTAGQDCGMGSKRVTKCGTTVVYRVLIVTNGTQ